MRERFYRLLTLASKFLGTWVFVVISRGIAAGYFLLFPRRVAVGVRFYRALFPEHGRSRHLWYTWKQFQNFTSVFLDRFLLQDGAPIRYSFEGRDHLLAAMRENRGGILLMTHMGNWEVAAHLLQQSLPDLRLMLYMGRQAGNKIEHLQQRDLKTGGIHVMAVDREGGSPFALVEAVSFLDSGGFVSMAGDRVWRSGQRVIPVRFLGHKVRLPEAPHVLALVSGAPVFIFFSSIAGRGAYHFSASAPIFVRAAARNHRSEAIARSAQTYADSIETQVRLAPFEWYHFEPFLGPKQP